MKLSPFSVKIEREIMQRDDAALWLAKHDQKHKRRRRRRSKRKGGADTP